MKLFNRKMTLYSFFSVLQYYLASVLFFSSMSLVNVGDVSEKINDNELKTLIKKLSSLLSPLRCSGPCIPIAAELPGTSYACWIQNIICRSCKGALTHMLCFATSINSSAMLCYFCSCSEYWWKGVSSGKQHSLGTRTAWGLWRGTLHSEVVCRLPGVWEECSYLPAWNTVFWSPKYSLWICSIA